MQGHQASKLLEEESVDIQVHVAIDNFGVNILVSTPSIHLCVRVKHDPLVTKAARALLEIATTRRKRECELEMVVSCCDYGCAGSFGTHQGLGFYRFPTFPHDRMKKWIAAVRQNTGHRPNIPGFVVKHFVSSKLIKLNCVHCFLRSLVLN